MTASLAANNFDFWRALAARDPGQAARTVLARIAALSPAHRRAIWAMVPDEQTLAAEFYRGMASRGPLAGVPFAVKDLFACAGLRTGAGSKFLATLREAEPEDAPIVAHLRRAGAVFAGKVHLHEFAYGLTGENPHFGDGPNLRLPGRISGGSSSGSASAVAGGIVPLALGTDTGGSVRVPAAFNGLWGFRCRPHDRWIERCFPLAPSFDTGGWFTTSAVDMLDVQRVMFGPQPESGRRDFVRLAARELAPEMDDAFAAALDGAAASYATSLPDDELAELRRGLDGALQAYVVIQSSEAATVHAPWLEAHRKDYDPVVWGRIDAGRRWSTEDIAAARARQAVVRAAFDAIWSRHDALLLPAAPFAALAKSECTDENRTRLLRLTHPASLAGAAVLTLPIGMADGTTAGLQVVLPDYHTSAVEHMLLSARPNAT